MRGDAGMAVEAPSATLEDGEAHDYRCGECGRRGHNARTCPDRAPGAGGQQALGLVPAADPVGDVVPASRGTQRAVRGPADEAPVIRLEVLGEPAPKGSGRAILIGGKARHVPSGSNARKPKRVNAGPASKRRAGNKARA